MEVTYSHCAGLDLYNNIVVACCITPGTTGESDRQTRTFTISSSGLLALSDWLSSQGITHVGMETNGELWKPVYDILRTNFEVLVVNAQEIKQVPGRKTEVKDAEWIAELLRHGLLHSSFTPPLARRDLQELIVQRSNLISERINVINRLQQFLKWVNLKLPSIVTDITDVSAQEILVAIIEGESHIQTQSRCLKQWQDLKPALSGLVPEQELYLIGNLLAHLDFLDEQIAVFDEQMAVYLQIQTSVTGRLS